MMSDLSDRYNEGVISSPDLMMEAPPLRQPENRLSLEEVARSRDQLGVTIVVLVAVGLICLLVTACAIYAGVVFLWH